MAGETWTDLVQSMTIKMVAQERALAEREASIVELRRALSGVLAMAIQYGALEANDAWVKDSNAALAQPAPQAALRGMLLAMGARICVEGIRDEGHIGQMADAILKGES